jgi:hypothetical protein
MHWIFEIYGNTFKALTLQRGERVHGRVEENRNVRPSSSELNRSDY